MQFNPLEKRFPSIRNPVYSKNGMVCTSQPLAAQVGAEILKRGGNAVDAAVATAACLTVVEPTSNGIGGDAFAIVWMNQKMYGLNGSGPSPEKISIEAVKNLGYETMPKFGMIPVTIPGAPKSWAALIERFGRLTLLEVLEPAIRIAREGYVVTPTLGKYWAKAVKSYCTQEGLEYDEWKRIFTVEGKAPKIGDVVMLKDHGDTLEAIGQSNGDAFYFGELAEKIHDFSVEHNGFIRKSDLEAYDVMWVDPISVNYKGYDIWEIPPNGQGIIALMGLNILSEQHVERFGTVDTYHKQFESMKLAFSDGLEHITEAQHMRMPTSYFLSKTYAEMRSSMIGEEALDPKAKEPLKSGTVYLATADNEGNMVSYIQSNYMGFGSGIVIPNTGIAMQNRGHTFSLDETHVNALMPKKKTYHTIIPGFITKDLEAVGPFGVMGGFMQPQGHLQVVMNMIDFKMNPQDALDAPRWQWVKGKTFSVEASMNHDVVRQLMAKGHDIQMTPETGGFGRGQIIVKTKKGTYVGGTESRTDGHIAIV